MTRVQRRGFTLTEILIVVGIIVIVALMASINLLRGRITGNEAVVLSDVRQLVVALNMYNAGYNTYPDPLGLLSDASPAYANPALTGGTGANGNPNLSGYTLFYTKVTDAHYTLIANPMTLGVTGTRAFYVDEMSMIHHCTGAGQADATKLTIDQPAVAC